MTPMIKKSLLYAIPSMIVFYIADLIARLWRLSTGNTLARLTATMNGITKLFQNPIPSLYPADLLFGIFCGGLLLAVLMFKARYAKKYRPDVEYGSARWGKPADIKPYIDPDPWQNVILTQTEGLMMGSRPKNPKHARNKNFLVVGGSGSGNLFCRPD